MLNRLLPSLALATVLLLARTGAVRAQGFGQNLGQDIGVKVSETSTLHVGVAAEAGYDTNVFYNDSARTSSAVFRVVPSILLTNNGRDGRAHSEMVYALGASLIYREYISDQADVRAQRGFIPSVMGSLSIPGAKTSFALVDNFTRTEDPPYIPTGAPIIRDSNQGSVTLGISPGGGRITASVRYTNALDMFETTEYRYASNMGHDGMLDLSWKWLPKTALFLQTGAGYTHYLYSADAAMRNRENSFAFRALGGIRGLLTPKTTINIAAGYATAFYQNSMNPSGVSNIHVTAGVGFIPTLVSRVNFTVMHGFRNSPVIGDYYDVDAANLGVNYLLGHLVAGLSGTYEYRRYQNYTGFVVAPGTMMPATVEIHRKDHLLTGGASLDYYIQKWFYAGASYSIGLVKPTGDPDPSAVPYTKQQVFARLGVSY